MENQGAFGAGFLLGGGGGWRAEVMPKGTPAEPGQGWTLREPVKVMGSTIGRECSREKWAKDSCLVTPHYKKETAEGGFGLLDSNSPDAQSLPTTPSAAEDTFNLLSPKASSKVCLLPCLGQLNNYIQRQSLHCMTLMQSVRWIAI